MKKRIKGLVFWALTLAQSLALAQGGSETTDTLETAQSFETTQTREKNPVKFTADATWSSKYIIDGFDVGGDKPVWQLSGKADLYDSGFSAMFWTALQVDRRYRQYDEQDFFLMYSKDFMKNSKYSVNLHGYYDYWVFPNNEAPRDQFGDPVGDSKKHGNKFQAGFSMPKLIPIGDSYLVPTYNLAYQHYFAQEREDLYQGGAYHELLVEYYQPIALFIPGATYQYAGGNAGASYHQGAFGVNAGFSHSKASMVTGVYALKSIFEATLNHQWSFEDSVNPEDELWTTVSFIRKF